MFSSTEDRKTTFARTLGALNTQFASWVAEQSSSAPQQLWTDGVEDYLQYARQLLADYKDVLPPLGNGDDAQKQQPQLQQQQQPEAAPTLFGAAAAGSAKPPSLAPGSLFGSAAGTAGTSGTAAAAPPSSIFGSLTAAPGAGGGTATGASMFNLGGGALGQASAGAPFGGFGAGSAANSGSALFAVPSTGTLGGSSINTGGGGGEGEDGEEGEEEEAGPSVQLEASEGTEMLAKQRAKLLTMSAEKKWKDKGTGTLTLRRASGADAANGRPYFVFTTDSGRVLINAPLVKGMKPTVNAKAAAALVMFLISRVDPSGPEERAMHMFRCDSGDAAKQLLATISELA